MRANISQRARQVVVQMFLAERQGGEEDTNNACGLRCGLLHVLFLYSRSRIIERRTLEMI